MPINAAPHDDLFFRAFAASGAAMLITGLEDGRIRHVNEAFLRLSGFAREGLVGRPPSDLRLWVEPAAHERLTTGLLEGASTDQTETRIRTRSGETRTAALTAQLLTIGGERCVLLIGHDITDRRRMEEALRQSEERYRLVVEHAKDVITLVDPEGTVVFVSPSVRDVLGYQPDELVGLNAMTLVHPEDVAFAAEGLAGVASGEPGGVSEVRVRHLDGRWVPTEAFGGPVYDARGNVRLVLGMLRDLTERRRAEEIVHRREAILEAVSFAAERFLSAPSWEAVIDDVLARLGEAAAVSRVHLCENEVSEQGTLFHTLRREWCAPGIGRQIDNPEEQRARYDGGFERWGEILSQGEIVHGLVRDAPPDERKVQSSEDVLSYAEVPVLLGGFWWGFIGFEDCEQEREFSQAEIDALKAAAGALGAAIGRKQTERALREAESRFRTLVEQIPAVTHISRLDETASTIYISPQVEEMLGYAPEEWAADDDLWGKCEHPDDRDLVAEANARHIMGGEPLLLDYRMIARDGRVVWIREHSVVVRDENGRTLFSQGVILDITEHKRAEQELQESDRLLRTATRGAPIVLFALDADGVFTLSEGKGLAALGLRPGEVVGRSVFDVYRDEPTVLSQIRRVLAGEEVQAMVEVGGLVFDVAYSPILDPGGEVEGLTAVATDITQRRRAEQEVKQSFELLRRADEQRRRLLAHLVSAQEEERQRIAVDIHDDPIQKMVAVGMRLDLLRRQLSEEQHLHALSRLEDAVGTAIARLRHLVFELRPPSLDREGLAAALGLYLREIADEGGFAYRVDNRLALEPPPEARAVAYRIAQEALSNVGRHARASRVDVLLESRDGGFLVRVRDNGVGFVPVEVDGPRPGHLGFPAMRERADLAGGWFRVVSSPGNGTTIEFWLPTEDAVPRRSFDLSS